MACASSQAASARPTPFTAKTSSASGQCGHHALRLGNEFEHLGALRGRRAAHQLHLLVERQRRDRVLGRAAIALGERKQVAHLRR